MAKRVLERRDGQGRPLRFPETGRQRDGACASRSRTWPRSSGGSAGRRSRSSPTRCPPATSACRSSSASWRPSAFGKPQKAYPYEQGFRLVVADKGVGLAGESDLATSYAIYTLLDQLGCRWYMPGPLGEVLPGDEDDRAATKQDLSHRAVHRSTAASGTATTTSPAATASAAWSWHAGHALEFTVPKELRKTNPEIRAIVGGKPHEHKVKWTHPLVAKAIADACLAQLAKDPTTCRPSRCRPTTASAGTSRTTPSSTPATSTRPPQTVSKTDRLMVLCNRVAAAVTAKHPDVKFGVLAYVDYTRPPVREKVHPSVVPQIAPITFSRAHPMTDDGEPNNKDLRAPGRGLGQGGAGDQLLLLRLLPGRGVRRPTR